MSNENEDNMIKLANAMSETMKRILGDRKIVILSIFYDVDSNQFTITTNHSDPDTMRDMLHAALARIDPTDESDNDEVGARLN